MTYRLVNILTAIIAFSLAMTLLFIPEIIYVLFSFDQHTSADVLAKRAAMLFIALGLITFMIKDHPPSPTRCAISNAIAVSMIALAGLGLFEFIRHQVGAGIFIAIVTELAIAALLFKTRNSET